MQSKVHPTYKAKYRVANWPAYNQALVRRGDVTVWLSSEGDRGLDTPAERPAGRAAALLHEYPLRVGRRGPHFSGPSAGATLRG